MSVGRKTPPPEWINTESPLRYGREPIWVFFSTRRYLRGTCPSNRFAGAPTIHWYLDAYFGLPTQGRLQLTVGVQSLRSIRITARGV